MRVLDGHHAVLEEERRLDDRGGKKFDRLAFARWALSKLAPRRMTVAIYRGARELRVERGRDLAGGPDARWAIVGIPEHASREHIAVALAELAGATDHPYVVDLLLGTEPEPVS
ncbi:MAG: hypothetical protein KC776_32515 [Myxococcales bacterium]|nr:hypothetical protein [Myxococcales bacterium]MCB9581218.1 hypothetical protein [Polyangiaceae bacterium]